MNVHVLPWLLIKFAVTEKATGIRDKELTFTIDPQFPTKVFAGRSSLLETLHEFKDWPDCHVLKKTLHTLIRQDLVSRLKM